MEHTNHETGIPQITKGEFVAGKIAEIERKFGRPLNEIISEKEQILGTIARMVGSDFGMKASFGAPGEGSFFIPEDKTAPKDRWNTIILDPLILLEFDGADEFTAAHEGSHRAITRTLDQVGSKTKAESTRYASKIGWAFIHNALEDPAVNDWVSSVYPRISDIKNKNYDKQFSGENAVMSTPQIEQMVAMLGYVPDFVRFGSEIMRYWHKGSYSNNLPEVLTDALATTQSSARSFYRTLPYSYPAEREVIGKAKARWKIYEEEIWPYVQKLIADDLTDEKLKQYLKNQLNKAIEQMNQEPEQGQPQSGQGKNLEELMDQFGFDEKEKEDLKEKIKEAQKQKTNKKGSLQDKLGKGEITEEEFKKQMQDVENSLPLDMKSLTDGTKKKIADKLSSESKEAQDQEEKAARKSLERAEDLANEDLRGKIAPKDESHQERRERQIREAETARQQAEKLAKEAMERKRQDEEYRKYLKEQEAKKSHWEKAVSDHAGQIDDLYKEIEDLFQKRRHPRWEKGHPSGQRLNMSSAMQYEADPRNYLRLWERKTIPDKMDYRFLFQIDLSESTEEGEIRRNEFNGTVIGAEVITALGIPNAIVGYTTGLGKTSNDVIEVYKGFDEDLNTDRDRLLPRVSKLLDQGGAYTPTIEATRISSAMLRAQSQKIRENAHFLIVVTDGKPTTISGVGVDLGELKQENDRLAEENNQIILGVGIGPGINEDNLREAYGEGRYVYARNQKDFPTKMAALLRAIFFQTQMVEHQV